MRHQTLSLVLVLGMSLLLTGCNSSPRLDTSSEEAMFASMEKMKAPLSVAKREELSRSIAVLVAPRMAEASRPGLFGADKPPTSSAELMQPFDGLTAEQLIARAKEQAK